MLQDNNLSWPLVFCGIWLAMLGSAHASSLVFIDPPSGDVVSTGGAISADGKTIVGLSTKVVASPYLAFRWSAKGGSKTLGFVSGLKSNDLATGVSGDGSVIVGFGNGTSGMGSFRWTKAGIQTLGLAKGDDTNIANGISVDGNVVVGATGSTTKDRAGAFRWTATNHFTSIGKLPGHSSAIANAVSANGAVVVGSSSDTPNKIERAFRWTAGGGMVDLGTLEGDTDSAAYGVSGDGSVVVGVSRRNTVSHAFRWTASGGMVNLGKLGGDLSAIAYATNGDGSVVVGESQGNSAVIGASRGFRWTTQRGMEDLRDVINAVGIDTPGGIQILSANGVSANGAAILGHGFDSNGIDKIFLATLAQPTISAVSPDSGAKAGGIKVVLTGTQFVAVKAVRFGAREATGLKVNSKSKITVTTPAHSAGAVAVTVETEAGVANKPAAYTFQ